MVESSPTMQFFGPVNALCFISPSLLLIGEGSVVTLYDVATSTKLKQFSPFTQQGFKITDISLVHEVIVI